MISRTFIGLRLPFHELLDALLRREALLALLHDGLLS
jgi:hypothetical protein